MGKLGIIILITLFLVLIITGIIGLEFFFKSNSQTEGEIAMSAKSKIEFQFQPISAELLNPLNPAEARIMLNKETERAFTGKYTDTTADGTYYCRQCNAPLYTSEDKFQSDCGWPSFDLEIPFAVERYTDSDGFRTEITCATCQAHLGHVFLGEHLTEKNTRHCVNSLSLALEDGPPVAQAIFAGGCFWGVEFFFEKLDGVYSAISGYTGGTMKNPTYQDVLTHTTGHLEAVQVLYNPKIISFEELTKYFLEIHDPTQTNGQGPDIGNQYLSAIFYRNRHEFDTALKLLRILEAKGLPIATTLKPASIFYPAEAYHQDYYEHKGTLPYCHAYTKRF
ncbi:bifunctional methionine sulfoxide reductase B/A protein [uncultured Sphaerochaeta sp.]|uniref:bifunctional methionine sulfoxide reductase B/A protein n=1 Tax=uncultured Sphaerochaeta sp. TaxID=886478 RepID=UPI002A0A6095|nr:bifunctional methionine sulfoxide reductase B/A protein [uncultured Sphaerochaeta sp.]